MVLVKPPPFAYVRPATLAEAQAVLAADTGAKVLAGGQSLVPLLSMRLVSPTTLVDINTLRELSYVRTGPDGVRVGALARHAEVERDEDARRVQPLLSRALRLVAHPTIRNRGTTVGSVVHADPSAEMPAVLALLDGSVTATSGRGARTLAAAELFVGPMESALAPDEIAVEAFFPALGAGEGVACEEVARRHGDFALCGVAAVVRVQEDRRVASARAAYFSVADVPAVLDLSVAFADGRFDDAAAADAATLAADRLEPLGDIHATAAYRDQLVRVLTRRALRAAYHDALDRQAA